MPRALWAHTPKEIVKVTTIVPWNHYKTSTSPSQAIWDPIHSLPIIDPIRGITIYIYFFIGVHDFEGKDECSSSFYHED